MLLNVPFGEAHINKGERVRKSKLASLRRKAVRVIKKQKLANFRLNYPFLLNYTKI